MQYMVVLWGEYLHLRNGRNGGLIFVRANISRILQYFKISHHFVNRDLFLNSFTFLDCGNFLGELPF